ncbi:MAG: MBL fold metallo-hydrolase [Bacteroidaceae bacterium]|jgi:hydroxyacylglutathione hydrolase
MQIKRFVVNPFQENCYLLSDETGEAVLLDPGCYFAAERTAVQNYISQNGLRLRHLLCTHLHPDHIFSLGFFEKQYNLKTEAHEGDLDWLQRAPWYSAQLGIDWKEEELGAPVSLECPLSDGDELHFGTHTVQVLYTPGHSQGSVCFYLPDEAVLFTGDTLFDGSVGRTDFPGGSMSMLQKSLREKIFTLPDEVEVWPGHGGTTALGREKRFNPFA